MKKIQGTLIALVSVLVLLTGCGNDPVKDDLSHYVNTELPTVAPLEKAVMKDFSNLMGKAQVTPQELSAAMTTKILPKYEEYIKQLEQMKPETTEVQKLHEQSLQAARTQLEAFRSITTAIQKQDQKAAAEAMKQLDESEKMAEGLKDSMQKLADEHHVK